MLRLGIVVLWHAYVIPIPFWLHTMMYLSFTEVEAVAEVQAPARPPGPLAGLSDVFSACVAFGVLAKEIDKGGEKPGRLPRHRYSRV